MKSTTVSLGSAIVTLLVALLVMSAPQQITAQTLSPGVNPACCEITGINSATGVATATANATGQSFQFKAGNAALVSSLRVGQRVFADFQTQKVSVDGVNPCCAAQGGVGAGAFQQNLGAAVNPGDVCCQITGIDSSGTVTARDNGTGRSFQFRVSDAGLLNSLHLGQSVSANFAAGRVAVANGTPCCQIVAAGSAPTGGISNTAGTVGGGSSASPGVAAGQNLQGVATPETPCCAITANAALTGTLGRVVVAFPQGANVSGSLVQVFKAGDTARIQTGYGAQSWELLPGTYTVSISGARVEGVTVQSGRDTRVRVGALRIKAEANTLVRVLDAVGKTQLASAYGAQVVGLPVGAFSVQVAGQSQTVNVQEGKITEF